MPRIIRDHRVYGKAYVTTASNEDEARGNIRKQTPNHIWEIKNIGGRLWEAYTAKPEDCFALND